MFTAIRRALVWFDFLIKVRIDQPLISARGFIAALSDWASLAHYNRMNASLRFGTKDGRWRSQQCGQGTVFA
jgi:hypothetical protein